MATWNPWHGCRKLSEGCLNCYVYRIDSQFGRDSSKPEKNSDFDLPVRKKKNGTPVIASGETVWTCFSSDFFLEDCDQWRIDAWRMIRERPDLNFFIVTKRPHRFKVSLPDDWGDGYRNVTICCTCENQRTADLRLPVFTALPIRHRQIICEPLLEPINLSLYLGGWIESVTVGGESGQGARLCDYDWVLDIRRQCEHKGVHFHFKQTGANFRKDGKTYLIDRKDQQRQAQKANIDL